MHEGAIKLESAQLQPAEEDKKSKLSEKTMENILFNRKVESINKQLNKYLFEYDDDPSLFLLKKDYDELAQVRNNQEKMPDKLRYKLKNKYRKNWFTGVLMQISSIFSMKDKLPAGEFQEIVGRHKQLMSKFKNHREKYIKLQKFFHKLGHGDLNVESDAYAKMLLIKELGANEYGKYLKERSKLIEAFDDLLEDTVKFLEENKKEISNQ